MRATELYYLLAGLQRRQATLAAVHWDLLVTGYYSAEFPTFAVEPTAEFVDQLVISERPTTGQPRVYFRGTHTPTTPVLPALYEL